MRIWPFLKLNTYRELFRNTGLILHFVLRDFNFILELFWQQEFLYVIQKIGLILNLLVSE